MPHKSPRFALSLRAGDRIFGFTIPPQSPYSVGAMWYVNTKFQAKQIENVLPRFGFTVRSSGGVARVE